MHPVDPHHARGTLTHHRLTRDAEDHLDWLENQRRPQEDVRTVDGAFVTGWLGAGALWAVLGLGATGGVVAAGAAVLLPLLGGR